LFPGWDTGAQKNGDRACAETLSKASSTPLKNSKVVAQTGNLPRVRVSELLPV